MEIVQVNCPRSIDLLSISNIKDNNKDAKHILQTVDIYDFISIKQEIKKQTGIIIISDDELLDTTKNKIKETIWLFSNYIGINIRDLIIEIKLDNFSFFKCEENILAGILIALNNYFKRYITLHELVFLADKIDPLISYYIVGGYKKIDNNNRSYNIGKNIYNKYLLIDKFNVINNEETNRFKSFLDNYENLSYGIGECCFIAIKDYIVSNIPISLKKNFSKVVIHTVNNVKEPKVLIKYLK